MTTMTILHRYDNGDGSGGSVGVTIGNGYVDDDEGDEDDHGDDADSVDYDDINDGIVMVMMMVIIPS